MNFYDIINVEKVVQTVYIVETDNRILRRYNDGCWEELVGMSWEPCYIDEEELEIAFQRFMVLNE